MKNLDILVLKTVLKVQIKCLKIHVRSTDITFNQSNKTRQPPVNQGPPPLPAPSNIAHVNFVAPLQKNTTLI